MKHVKLNITHVRRLIKEAIEARMPGSPEPFEVSDARLHESTAGGDEFGPVLSAIANRWMSMYDPADPSMAHVGEKKWQQQVNMAIDDLEQRLSEACDDVEERLIGYRSNSASARDNAMVELARLDDRERQYLDQLLKGGGQ